MINANVFNLQRVDIGTCLLVEEVLLHGFINFLSGHFVLEITTDGFVDLVHVRSNVLTGENGWCAENTHRLTAIVVCIGRVATRSGVEAVVDGEVADLMVAGDGLTGCAFVVLDPIEALEVDEVVVQVVNRGVRVGIERRRQELRGQGQASVLSVNGR